MEQTELGRWPVTIEIPVAWGDMDSLGHVNNAVYLRWFESARITYFERAGIMDRLEADQVGPILARAAVDYRKPIRYPDTVAVSCTVLRIATSSFVMRSRLTCKAHGAELAAEAEMVVVMLDYRTGQKILLDPGFRSRIVALEGQGPPPTPP